MKKKIVIFCLILMLVSSVHFVNIAPAKHTNEYEVPDYVEIGDFLYMDYSSDYKSVKGRGYMNDHIALYIGNNTFVHVHRNSGVEINDYEYFQTNYKYHVFGYVITANSSQKENAAIWAESKVGQQFQYSVGLSKKGFNNRWYNAEIVWAAYYQQGIDIDQDGWDKPRQVTVQEIIDDFDTETYITHPVPSYLKRGDIVLMDSTDYDSIWAIPGYSNDHVALYLGHDYRNGNYYINAFGQGVYPVSNEYFCLFLENFTYYYVTNASNAQIDGAVKWTEDLIGAEYQVCFPQFFDPYWWYNGMFELALKCEDPNNKNIKTADRFYCGELVWATYYNQGIDIDQNGWEKIKPVLGNNFPKSLINWWDRYGWALACVDADDIVKSKNITERLPLL